MDVPRKKVKATEGVVAIDTVILWTPANIMGPFVREAGNGQWCFNRTS
jgi:hypothetical protein